jgi:hypothetical protein
MQNKEKKRQGVISRGRIPQRTETGNKKILITFSV